MQREATLHAGAEADLADQEGLAQAGALTSDHHTGEGLDTGVVAFLDLDVDVDGVAGTERRDLLGGLHVLGVKCLNSVNHCYSLVAAAYQRTGLGFGDDWHHEHVCNSLGSALRKPVNPPKQRLCARSVWTHEEAAYAAADPRHSKTAFY